MMVVVVVLVVEVEHREGEVVVLVVVLAGVGVRPYHPDLLALAPHQLLPMRNGAPRGGGGGSYHHERLHTDCIRPMHRIPTLSHRILCPPCSILRHRLLETLERLVDHRQPLQLSPLRFTPMRFDGMNPRSFPMGRVWTSWPSALRLLQPFASPMLLPL